MNRPRRTRKQVEDAKGEAKSLGLALLLLRRLRGFSCAELAAAAGTSRSKLSIYETGRALPRHDSIRPIMIALGLPTTALYEVQQYMDELMGRETGRDGTLPPDRPRASRTDALRLAQEAGKAVAHCCLAFMELQAGGWEDGRHGE